MVPVTLPSLLKLSLKGVEELVCQFSMKAVSHMAQENRRWREKANEGIIGCSEEEEDEIKVLSFMSLLIFQLKMKYCAENCHITTISCWHMVTC